MRARSTISETTKASKRALCDGTGGLLAGGNYGAVSGRIGKWQTQRFGLVLNRLHASSGLDFLLRDRDSLWLGRWRRSLRRRSGPGRRGVALQQPDHHVASVPAGVP